MLQDVLFRHYCQNIPVNQQRQMRKYKHKNKKQSKPQTHDLPIYILQKFREDKLSPVKDSTNKFSLQKYNTQSQIFMQRNKMNKYRQSLSPLRNNKNLREYSNLLFPKKTYEQLKGIRNDHFQTLHQKKSEKKYSTLNALSCYNHLYQNKTLKQMQQNTNDLQINRLPILSKSNNRRKQNVEALQMQHLTISNLGADYFPSREKSTQLIEARHLQTLQICGWQDGDLFQ